MITRLFSAIFLHAPETTWFSGIRIAPQGATVQRLCNGGALHLKALKGLGKVRAATLQR